MSKNRHFQLKSTLQMNQNVTFSLMKLRKRVKQSFFVLHTFRTDSSKYCKNFVFLLQTYTSSSAWSLDFTTLQMHQNVKVSLMKLRKRLKQSFFVLHT